MDAVVGDGGHIVSAACSFVYFGILGSWENKISVHLFAPSLRSEKCFL